MKNIHVLPTDKPSRLLKQDNCKFILSKTIVFSHISKHLSNINQNIYITSDEEIKEGDWFISLYSNSIQKELKLDWILNKDAYKKIILTTDQDLIKDGVQSIDDEFLEWFVKNPSCEEVEFKKKSRCCGRCNGVDDLCYTDMCCDDHHEYGCEECYGRRVEYEIIIPKEEQKQHLIDMMRNDEELGLYDEPKQETLEEAAERYRITDGDYDLKTKIAFEQGAKWKAERMYSEEEVMEMFHKLSMHLPLHYEFLVREMFKKK